MSSRQEIIKEILKSPFVHALAGGIGGVAALAATYPLDIIKTRLQVQASRSSDVTHYQGTMDALQKIVEEEGILGLYKGLSVGLLHTLINQFVYFYFYEALKPVYHRHLLPSDKQSHQLGTFWQLLLGVHAAAMNSAVTIPISVVSTRIQTDRKTQDGLVATFSKIVEHDGMSGLWRGLQPALILSINPAITHLFYERLKEWLEHRIRLTNPKAHLSPLQVFVIGAISKTISTVVTYPYILAKVRLQWKSQNNSSNGNGSHNGSSNHDHGNHKEGHGVHYKGTWDVLTKVVQSDGFFGLFRGMTPQIVKGVLSQAILFMMKEEIMSWTIKLILLFYGLRKKDLGNKQ